MMDGWMHGWEGVEVYWRGVCRHVSASILPEEVCKDNVEMQIESRIEL